MGAKVGAIPSAIGGHEIRLSHVGKVFEINPRSRRWKDWLRYVHTDQIWVWGVFCFLGVTQREPGDAWYPVQIYDRVPALIKRSTWRTCLARVLVCHAVQWILVYSDAVGQHRHLVRTVTDALWMSNKRLRDWRWSNQRIYYGILIIFSVGAHWQFGQHRRYDFSIWRTLPGW